LPRTHKTAPIFYGTEPDNLLPWLGQLEKIFAAASTKEDQAKKWLALEWMDFRMKLEWETNEVLLDNTKSWEDELKKGYPDAMNFEKGSKTHLQMIVQKHQPVHQ
ncbi:hypothetical protein GYMLUDRAFT_179762, partial [Collybiopsis luxurians FD-317 M1]